MTNMLLGYLCAAVTVQIAWMIREHRSVFRYRKDARALLYDQVEVRSLALESDLMARAGRAVVASQRADKQRNGDKAGRDEVAHNSSFPGWDK